MGVSAQKALSERLSPQYSITRLELVARQKGGRDIVDMVEWILLIGQNLPKGGGGLEMGSASLSLIPALWRSILRSH